MIHIDWSKAPEGATHYCLSAADGTQWRDLSGDLAKYWLNGQWNRHGGLKSADMLCGSLNFVERPVQAAWNGEGLPPAGTVCEIHDRDCPEDSWQSATIRYIGKVYCIAESADGLEQYHHIEDVRFRPIRTAEQIKADERREAVQQMLVDVSNFGRGALHFTVAENLYDAGYRKQVAP